VLERPLEASRPLGPERNESSPRCLASELATVDHGHGIVERDRVQLEPLVLVRLQAAGVDRLESVARYRCITHW